MFFQPHQLPFAIFAAIAALFIPLLLFTRRMERKRSEALSGESARLGMTFKEDGGELRHEDFYILPLFSQGHSKQFRNVMCGTNEIVFGFEYTTNRGRTQHTTQQTVAAFRTEGCDFPSFQLKPETLADVIIAKFGGQDIDFPQDPEFSKAFRLRGIGELMIRELFDSGTRGILLNNPGWSLQGSREWVIAFRKGERAKTSEMSDFVTTARRITQHFADR